MEEAIKKAVEGGYEETERLVDERDYYVFLDKRFWEALGKSLKWGNLQWKKMYGDFAPSYQTKRWHYEWHHFIDHLADGGDVESFFKELLANK